MMENDRTRRNRILPWLTGMFLLATTFPAMAASVLFQGIVYQRDQNVNPTPPGGTLATGTGSASVMGSNPASFTLPAGAFAGATSSTGITTVPGLAVLSTSANWLVGGLTDGGGGNLLAAGYFPASVPITIPANQTAYPNTGTVRSGFLRLLPGANGFGGKVGGTATVAYFGLLFGSPSGYYDFRNDANPAIGGRAGGGSKLIGTGLATHTFFTTSGVPLQFSTVTVGTSAPWITGTVTAYNNRGYSISNLTNMGTDARSAAGMGTISLVSPRLLFVYDKFGGVVQGLNAALGGVSFTNNLLIGFVPEPAVTVLLGAGVFGIAALYTARRRRR